MAKNPGEFHIGGVTVTVTAKEPGFEIRATGAKNYSKDRYDVLYMIYEALSDKYSLGGSRTKEEEDIIFIKNTQHQGTKPKITLEAIHKLCEQYEGLIVNTHEGLEKYLRGRREYIRSEQAGHVEEQAKRDTQLYLDTAVEFFHDNLTLDADQKKALAQGRPLVLNTDQIDALHAKLTEAHLERSKEKS